MATDPNAEKAKEGEAFNQKIMQQFCAIAKSMNCSFTLRGEPISIERALALDGLLPAIIRRADQLCSFCFDFGLGMTYERATNGLLGVTVEFSPNTQISLLLLCATDVLVEIMQHAPTLEQTPLDELMLE